PEVGLITAEVPPTKRIAALGIFDFDDFGAHVREQHGAVGPRNEIPELQNSDTVQTTIHKISSSICVDYLRDFISRYAPRTARRPKERTFLNLRDLRALI